MSDFFWSTQNPNGQDVRCEGGEVVHVDPKNIGAIAGDAGNFVWADPTAVQAGNVFNNWPDLAAAILKVRGQKTVTCVAAALTMTAGAWPDITDVTFVAGETVPVNVVVTVADGATLTSIHRITLDSVIFEYAGTTVPCVTLTGTQELVFDLRNAGAVGTTGTQPMVSVGGTATLLSFCDRGCVWGAGTVAIAAIGATASFLLFNASALSSGAVTATALGTVDITLDGASQALLSPTAVGTIAPNIEVTDPQPTFVFRPGATGVVDGNVFTTWAALMAAVSLTAGSKEILVDDTLAAAHATTGTWNLDNVTLNTIFNSAGLLIVDDGSVWTWSALRIRGGLTVQSAATAAVTSTAAASANLLTLDEGSNLESTTATPFVAVAGAGSSLFVELSRGSTMGDGTHHTVTVDAGLTAQVLLTTAADLLAHASGGTGTLLVFRDASTTFGTQDTTTTTVTLSDLASQVAYTATTAGNWNPNPTKVADALDQLAAPNFTQASGNTGTGTGSVTVTTGNIAKKKNGAMNVRATISGVTTSATTVTLQLSRSGTNIGSAIVVTTLSAGDGFTGAINFIDTAPDAANHTYTLTATAGAGNLTIAANSAQIGVSEQS